MFRLHHTSLFLACLLAVVAGCQQPTSRAPRPGLPDTYPAPINNPDITVIDEDLRQWLGFHPAVVVRSGSQPMQVEVPVRNESDNGYLVEYRYRFFDASGLLLEPVMGWRFQPIEPKQVVHLTGKALSQEAKSYKLEVRWSK